MKRDPIQPFTEELEALSEPVKGGTKNSELPDYEHIPKDQLLSELDFDKNLTDEQLKALHEVILKNHKAFGLDGRLGTFSAKVNIQLKEGAKEISLAPSSASPANREIIDKQINEWFRLGAIRESKSPWGAPGFLVWRDGKPCLVIDYRQVNAHIIPDEYPLPKMMDYLHSLYGAEWLSIFAALAGFTQLELDDAIKEITAFRTHRGLLELNCLRFGLKIGPSVFQRVTQGILAKFLWIFALVYIDDILVFSPSFSKHIVHLGKVLGAIADSRLTLSPKKCHIGYRSLVMLGQKVSRLGMSTHKQKVDAVVQLEPPKNIPTWQTFLGMMTYFPNHTPFYPCLPPPLFNLLQNAN